MFLKDTTGVYENYRNGQLIMMSWKELQDGYIIQGFKDYVYIKEDIDFVICKHLEEIGYSYTIKKMRRN